MRKKHAVHPGNEEPTQVRVWQRAAEAYEKIAQKDRVPGKRIWAAAEAKRCRRLAQEESAA